MKKPRMTVSVRRGAALVAPDFTLGLSAPPGLTAKERRDLRALEAYLQGMILWAAAVHGEPAAEAEARAAMAEAQERSPDPAV